MPQSLIGEDRSRISLHCAGLCGYDCRIGYDAPAKAYVFEVDNPEEFKKTLEDKAQLNWNICTVADEMKITIEGDYVFFIMSPESFEE